MTETPPSGPPDGNFPPDLADAVPDFVGDIQSAIADGLGAAGQAIGDAVSGIASTIGLELVTVPLEVLL